MNLLSFTPSLKGDRYEKRNRERQKGEREWRGDGKKRSYRQRETENRNQMEKAVAGNEGNCSGVIKLCIKYDL